MLMKIGSQIFMDYIKSYRYLKFYLMKQFIIHLIKKVRMEIQIIQEDVIKLMLQYCKENGLIQTFQTLSQESKIALNSVDNKSAFLQDIERGKWDQVIRLIPTLCLPSSLLMELLKQIVIEMLEYQEQETAELIVKEVMVENNLDRVFPEKVQKLEKLCRKSHSDFKKKQREAIENKEKKRKQLSSKIGKILLETKSSRLMELLGQALKYQQYNNPKQKANLQLNIFTGEVLKQQEEPPKIIDRIEKVVKFPQEAKCQMIKFSHNGKFVVVGGIDGIIEVWDSSTGKLRKDLDYQGEDNLMLHSSAIYSLDLTQDDDLLASGDVEGNIKVWRVATGRCLRKFEQVFGKKTVSCLQFGKDISHLLFSNEEIKVAGLKSGKIIKEFRGHTCLVNDLMLLEDGMKLASGDAGGNLRIWNYLTTECLHSFDLQVKIIRLLNLKQIYLVTVKEIQILLPPNYSPLIQTQSAQEKVNDFILFCEESRVPNNLIIIKEDGCLEQRSANLNQKEIKRYANEGKIEVGKNVIGIAVNSKQNQVVLWDDMARVLWLGP
eukprot:TRINITY_DN6174_c0_g1_i2.p2 TRINITY_DN6174_c0_g1~~TRINITY_DN6174_c0_g1_i2.p2  ORF type:complete len:548 (+),score=109.35 TRINITY_DN6174_c0_g1_i2:140-1783(+)